MVVDDSVLHEALSVLEGASRVRGELAQPSPDALSNADDVRRLEAESLALARRLTDVLLPTARRFDGRGVGPLGSTAEFFLRLDAASRLERDPAPAIAVTVLLQATGLRDALLGLGQSAPLATRAEHVERLVDVIVRGAAAFASALDPTARPIASLAETERLLAMRQQFAPLWRALRSLGGAPSLDADALRSRVRATRYVLASITSQSAFQHLRGSEQTALRRLHASLGQLMDAFDEALAVTTLAELDALVPRLGRIALAEPLLEHDAALASTSTVGLRWVASQQGLVSDALFERLRSLVGRSEAIDALVQERSRDPQRWIAALEPLIRGDGR